MQTQALFNLGKPPKKKLEQKKQEVSLRLCACRFSFRCPSVHPCCSLMTASFWNHTTISHSIPDYLSSTSFSPRLG